MKNRKTRIIKVFSIIMLLVVNTLLITGIFVNNNLKAENLLVSEMSLVQKQKEIDKTLTSANYTIDRPNIVLNPYKISPLTAIIIFETETEVAPEVIIKGLDQSVDIIHHFEKNTKHFLPIYGLYPDYLNNIIINIDDQSYPFQIETDPLPKDLEDLKKETYVDNEHIDLINDQFYFVTPASGGYTSAYDLDGKVRWYLTEKMVWDIDRLENGNLLLSSERLINPPYYTTGLYEVSLLGKIYNEFTLPGGYHHDVFELENNNLIVASNNFIDGTVEDYIVEVDRLSGEIVKEIDLKEILETEEGKSENWVEYDWFHNNSVWYDKTTNSLTLSGRHQDVVVNLNYDSLEINYILGESTGVSEDYKQYFLEPIGELEWQYSQHAAMIIPDGNLFVFDNGNNRAKIEEDYIMSKDNYSRGVIYDVNQEDMTVNQVYQYGKERGSDYYSSYISDVDYLNDNHYIIHSGGVAFKDEEVMNNPPGLNACDSMTSYTTEVLNNEKIFELVLGNNNYRAEKMNLYYPEENFLNTEAKSLGGFNETEKMEERFDLLLNVESNPEVLKAYNLDIRKEVDRLIISGDFDPSDEVSVILYNNFKIKEYHVRVSKQPYTAMCIDLLHDKEKITIDKYINDKGLKGQHSIFIKVNGNIYATSKLVDFE